MSKETARQIDAAAADWAARIDRGPLSEDQEREFNEWLEGDVRRPGAFGRVHAIALHTLRARALGPTFDPGNFRDDDSASPRLSRRRALVSGGAIAAGFAALAGGYEVLGLPRHYHTATGEIRVLPLADGSVVTLNTASHLAVKLTKVRREIELIQGEALFDVAKDPNRPFVVVAGLTQTRAVGTSFAVRRLAEGPVQVLVREGVVEMTRKHEVAAQPLRLGADMLGVAEAGKSTLTATTLAPPELQRQLAWQTGRIVFNGQTLQEAAAEFGRYSHTKIVVADQELGREEVAGMFETNDPVGFARAVAIALNGRVELKDGEVILSR